MKRTYKRIQNTGVRSQESGVRTCHRCILSAVSAISYSMRPAQFQNCLNVFKISRYPIHRYAHPAKNPAIRPCATTKGSTISLNVFIIFCILILSFSFWLVIHSKIMDRTQIISSPLGWDREKALIYNKYADCVAVFL